MLPDGVDVRHDAIVRVGMLGTGWWRLDAESPTMPETF